MRKLCIGLYIAIGRVYNYTVVLLRVVSDESRVIDYLGWLQLEMQVNTERERS